MTATLAAANLVGMPLATSTAYELANLRLELARNTSLARFVSARRRQSPPRSWRLIARDFHEATGHDVSDETLRIWFGAKETAK